MTRVDAGVPIKSGSWRRKKMRYQKNMSGGFFEQHYNSVHLSCETLDFENGQKRDMPVRHVGQNTALLLHPPNFPVRRPQDASFWSEKKLPSALLAFSTPTATLSQRDTTTSSHHLSFFLFGRGYVHSQSTQSNSRGVLATSCKESLQKSVFCFAFTHPHISKDWIGRVYTICTHFFPASTTWFGEDQNERIGNGLLPERSIRQVYTHHAIWHPKTLSRGYPRGRRAFSLGFL